MTNGTIGVTGASGYVGQALIARALRARFDVVTIGRRGLAGLPHRHADLEEVPEPQLLDGLDALIHLAADTSGANRLAAAEMRFAETMASLARRARIPLVVVSSQAASSSAPSEYGRTKAAIERLVLPYGAVVVRPGMVYGGPARGMFGTLLGLVRKMPVLPDLRPRPWVQPIEVDDLADALLAAIGRAYRPGHVWCVAGPPIAFVDFLAGMARYRLRRRRWRIPVPLVVLRMVLRWASPVFGATLSPERLDSLTQLPGMECDADLAALGVQPRALADGLSPSGRPGRRLLLEGCALMHGFLGRPPSRWLSRRYVLALRHRGFNRALTLHESMLACPAQFAALDTTEFRRIVDRGSLPWRYSVAIRIVEASTAHTTQFIRQSGRTGRASAILDVLRAIACEVQGRCLRPYARHRSQGPQ